jgi:hypothetical protein
MYSFIQAEVLQKNIIPADSSWVIHVDLERFFESRFYSHMAGQEAWDHIEKQNARFVKKFKIDLLQDITAVTVFGKAKDEDTTVACLHGAFDREYLLGLLEMEESHREIAHGTYTIHNWDRREYGAFAGDRMALLGKSETALKDALDVISGKAADITQSDSAALIGRIPTDSFLTAMAHKISALTKGPKMPRLLKKAESAMIHISEKGKDMLFGAEMTASTPEDADNIEQIIRGLMALGDMHREDLPADIHIPEDIKITRSGKNVRMEMSYPTEDLIALISAKGRFPFGFALTAVLSPLHTP